VVEPALGPTDVGALAKSVLDGLEWLPRNRIHEDLGSVVVPIDAAKVERILENLLVNANRHTPRTPMSGCG